MKCLFCWSAAFEMMYRAIPKPAISIFALGIRSITSAIQVFFTEYFYSGF